MRLFHAVLLPGIVVFVSKVTLLQAHAPRRDVADDPASGLRHTGAEGTVKESRMSGRSVEVPQSEYLNNITEALVKWVEQRFPCPEVINADLYETLKAKMNGHFNILWGDWKRDHPIEIDEMFYYSTENNRLRQLVGRVNSFLPVSHHFDANDLV